MFVDSIRRNTPAIWTLLDHTLPDPSAEGGEGCPYTEFGDGHVFAIIEAEVPAGSYRCDFMFTVENGRRLAVECDGHDFHERTKQQASYDRARDRELLMIGIPTIRFTGSDLAHCADRCASETWKLVALISGRA
jgi:hypothetical protein